MTKLNAAAERRERWIAAVTSGDANEYAALVAEDVLWIPPSGEPLRGRAAFKDWLAPFVRSFEYEMTLRPSASFEFEGWAWETGAFVSTMRAVGSGGSQQHGGRYFVLWRLDADDTWRIDRYVDGVGREELEGNETSV